MEVNFKKKTKRGAGRPRFRRLLDNTEDGNGQDEDDGVEMEKMQCDIQELREDQRLRDQILKEKVASLKAEKKKKKEAVKRTSHYGLHDVKKDGSASTKLLTLLDGQFTGQSVTTDTDQHEALMNQFIEERLQKKRQREKQEDTVEDHVKVLKSVEDQLFELPAHLKPQVSSSTTHYDDGTEGGMLMGNAGIAEVELPLSYSEKTELATEKALAATKGGERKLDAIGGLATSGLPANFSVDYNRHRTDYVAEMKSLNKDERRERGFQQVGKHQASDDRAVSRFRKFESRQMRR